MHLYSQRHPDRMKAVYAAYYANHRERVLGRQACYRQEESGRFQMSQEKYRAHHQETLRERKANRRAREQVSRLTPGLVNQLLVRQQGRCPVCRMRLSEYQLDHIEPLRRGGDNCDANMQLLCPHCNRSKGAKDPIQFMQLKGYLL